jgi:hypothetical protein
LPATRCATCRRDSQPATARSLPPPVIPAAPRCWSPRAQTDSPATRPAGGRSGGAAGSHGLAGMEHPVQVDVPAYAERPRREQPRIAAVPPARSNARPHWSPPVIRQSPEIALRFRHLIVALLVSHRNPLDRRHFRLRRTREECRTPRASGRATLPRVAQPPRNATRQPTRRQAGNRPGRSPGRFTT